MGMIGVTFVSFELFYYFEKGLMIGLEWLPSGLLLFYCFYPFYVFYVELVDIGNMIGWLSPFNYFDPSFYLSYVTLVTFSVLFTNGTTNGAGNGIGLLDEFFFS